jgi:hypothetical protein
LDLGRQFTHDPTTLQVKQAPLADTGRTDRLGRAATDHA